MLGATLKTTMMMEYVGDTLTCMQIEHVLPSHPLKICNFCFKPIGASLKGCEAGLQLLVRCIHCANLCILLL